MTNSTVFGMDVTIFIEKTIFVALVAAIAFMLDRVLSRTLKRIFDASNIASVSIFTNIGRAFIWMFALLVVLEPVFGIQPTAFVTALGVGSVAISLGMQDSISNIIGGLSLMTNKVIRPGDVITVNTYTGVVRDITWRNTTLITFGGDQVIIPNSVLNKTALVRFSKSNEKCQTVDIPVRVGADLNAVATEACALVSKALTAGEHNYLDATPVSCSYSTVDAAGIHLGISFTLKSLDDVYTATDLAIRAISDRPWVASYTPDADAAPHDEAVSN